MTIQLANRVRRLNPSASIAAKQMVTDLRASGRRVIDLTIGEPDFATPDHIVQAAVAAMQEGDTHYTPTAGTISLRSAVAEKFRRENGVDVKRENVIVGTGAKQLIFEALAATVEQGVEVIVPAPYWVSYPDMVQVHGGTAVIVKCPETEGFKLTASALEAAIAADTRWVVLNAPNNPTGAVYSAQELQAIGEVLKRHRHVAVMTDEIYEHIVFTEEKPVSFLRIVPELAERTLVINGVSKAYAMTGWRIGYAVGPKNLVEAMAKLIGQSTTCASAISQAAAVAALNGDQSFVAEAVAKFKSRRDKAIEILRGTPGLTFTAPTGAFYLYPSVAGLIGRKTPSGKILETDTDVVFYLLEHSGVAVLDGTPYGLSPYIRLAFGTSLEEVEAGAKAIRKACEKLFEEDLGEAG